MGEVLDSEGVLNEAIGEMSSPLGDVYHALGDEVAWSIGSRELEVAVLETSL